jgi:hypothetical protein
MGEGRGGSLGAHRIYRSKRLPKPQKRFFLLTVVKGLLNPKSPSSLILSQNIHQFCDDLGKAKRKEEQQTF